MKTATVTDFRTNMKDHLEAVEDDQDFLILTGPKQKDFVVLPLELFNAMQETAHLVSTSANTNRLMESIRQDQQGKVVSKDSPSRRGKETALTHKSKGSGLKAHGQRLRANSTILKRSSTKVKK